MVLLGSTGSIGTAALDIARRFSLPVETLVAGNNAALLQQQIDEFQPKRVVIGTAEGAAALRHPDVRHGEAAILAAIEESQSPVVLNALVGFLGLKPTLKAIECRKRVALANKESLVAAGKFVDVSKIHPVDSEHFGLWYLQSGRPIERLILTASGGALRDLPIENIENAPLEAVLKHPNWAMGSKITIDSATMVNKLFEVLEARWLFGDVAIDGVIERSSIVHALIEFKDGCTTAQLSRADMRLPIAHALLERVETPIADPVNLTALAALRFEPIDLARYPVWALKEPLLKTPELGAVVNAANEAALLRYLNKEIAFGGIARLILAAFERFQTPPQNLEAVFALDAEVRNWCQRAQI
ncbi:MAG: 1-deoxy-D-xylulose-5-phosphate reductoisomerase [Campylobacterales bacterium]